MAKTQGHGNPHWTRDETILALDLFFDLGGKIPSGRDNRIQELSELLQSLPYHDKGVRKPSFRNPDGVAFKLQNLRKVATGKGLGNVSETDRQVWLEFENKRKIVKSLANLIRRVAAVSEPAADDDDGVEFVEGKLITQLHKRRERNSKLRAKLLLSRKRKGKIFCEMCGIFPISTNPTISDAQFEVHHLIPLSTRISEITRLSETVLLCASCHRLLHRAIAVQRRWLSIEEAREICGLDNVGGSRKKRGRTYFAF